MAIAMHALCRSSLYSENVFNGGGGEKKVGGMTDQNLTDLEFEYCETETAADNEYIYDL
jgi:hypothetical protein